MLVDVTVNGRELTADWIETTMAMRGTRPIGHDELYRLAEEEVGLGAPQIGLALRTMQRRQQFLGDGYPFLVNDVAVRAKEGVLQSPYSSLLFMTPDGIARQTVARDTSTEMEVLFERITERALSRLWGDSGRALRFGWPSDIGRPQSFNDAVIWLAEQLGIQPGTGYRPPRRKDGGVDVVAWRPFPDGRGGIPLILAQCTLQSEIRSKSTDIDTRVWASWLVMDVDPVTALAVPQTIPSGVLWGELALRGMVLERMRLVELLAFDEQMVALSEWNSTLSEKLQPLMAGSSE
jgi:hypothetical protein